MRKGLFNGVWRNLVAQMLWEHKVLQVQILSPRPLLIAGFNRNLFYEKSAGAREAMDWSAKPSRVERYHSRTPGTGWWCNGSTTFSKNVGQGSIPCLPAKYSVYSGLRGYGLKSHCVHKTIIHGGFV